MPSSTSMVILHTNAKKNSSYKWATLVARTHEIKMALKIKIKGNYDCCEDELQISSQDSACNYFLYAI